MVSGTIRRSQVLIDIDGPIEAADFDRGGHGPLRAIRGDRVCEGQRSRLFASWLFRVDATVQMAPSQGQHDSAERPVFDEIAQRLGRLLEGEGAGDQGLDPPVDQRGQDGRPGRGYRVCGLDGERESFHSGALPDQVRDIDRRRTAGGVAERDKGAVHRERAEHLTDRKSTRLNSSHVRISYAVFCLKKKKTISRLKSISK